MAVGKRQAKIRMAPTGSPRPVALHRDGEAAERHVRGTAVTGGGAAEAGPKALTVVVADPSCGLTAVIFTGAGGAAFSPHTRLRTLKSAPSSGSGGTGSFTGAWKKAMKNTASATRVK
jgi:hypothetical protein